LGTNSKLIIKDLSKEED